MTADEAKQEVERLILPVVGSRWKDSPFPICHSYRVEAVLPDELVRVAVYDHPFIKRHTFVLDDFVRMLEPYEPGRSKR